MNEIITSDWLYEPLLIPDAEAEEAARSRQPQLIKPPGSLGRLEDIAIRLAGMQGTDRPSVEDVQIAIFVGDHGVAAEGVSAFPQQVTSQMIRLFSQGGSAISVLAQALHAPLDIVNLGTAHDCELSDDVTNYNLGPGTANFIHGPAMTESQLDQSLFAGCEAIDCAQLADAQLLVVGEMGIANSTSATALACALLNAPPEQLTGPGTGLDANGVTHKIKIIQRALDMHHDHLTSPMEALRRVGGFEIAALTGAYIRCAQVGLPVIVDGYIASVAALAAQRLHPGIEQWQLFSHLSTEPGHRHVLTALDAKPLLDLDLCLGEGSGAAVLIPIVRLACALHNNMATFAEAQISEKI